LVPESRRPLIPPPRDALYVDAFPTRRSSDLVGYRILTCRNQIHQVGLTACPPTCDDFVIAPRRVHTASGWVDSYAFDERSPNQADRKSTRLNSSHVKISYAVFCWKKKKTADP